MSTILGTLKSLFSRRREPSRAEVSGLFRFKYSHFKELLASNAELLNIITDMEEKLQGRQVFGMSYVRSQSARAAFYAFRMAKSINILSGNRYPQLYAAVGKINEEVKAGLGQKRELAAPALIMSYTEINKDMTDWVGGKSANLGEVLNRVGLPIPAGFAITTRAFEVFLAESDLVDEINRRKMELDPSSPESIEKVSEEIQRLIIAAAMPSELEEAMLAAYRDMAAALESEGAASGLVRVAMRSSAIGEDAELSFAGQYLTMLNVAPDQLIQAYKFIVASLYTPRAMSYRLNKGIRDEDIAMSVACLHMVDSVASGVMYSHHPFNPLEDKVIINAVWGLGPYVVDGVITPDTFMVAKDEGLTLVKSQVSHKPVQLSANPQGGVTELAVAGELQDQPCLTPAQIKTLAGYAVKLEEHYRGFQDIEWALHPDGRLLVLQSRPLHLEAPEGEALKEITRVSGYPVLVEGGDVAFPGVGFGPAVHVASEEDLLDFPDGAVLVARHSSPKFVMVMPKAQAIITDSGSVTGHMASLSREFAVPTILGAQTATRDIPAGREVTVDAYSGRVYQGKVPELLALRHRRESHMQDTPVYQTLRKVADHVVPLHLVDPKAPEFTPEHCRTLHDVGRLVHEFSYQEMFAISDLVSDTGVGAVKLDAPVRLDLYIIDLGGGLASDVSERTRRVTVEQIESVPMLAVLKGMLHPALQVMEPRPVELGGLLSVMREQMLATPGERFGDRTYAIISDKYLNFSSRVGYHYSVLDCYCGATINKNYITFSFKGGAADDTRRNRRARAIAIMLMGLDFSVEVKGDRVDARLMKYERPVLEEKLEMLGRLLQFTRQMDMLMTSEVSVEALAKNFLDGNYQMDFKPEEPQQALK